MPLSFGADYPDPYFKLTPDERDTRGVIGSSQCVIDGEHFFIRGLLEIPIIGSEDKLLWGLWATVWERDYDEIAETWQLERIIQWYRV
jgi:hypothetical protein